MFEGKTKEEILKWYVDNVPVGSVIELGTKEYTTCDTPFFKDTLIVVPCEDSDGDCVMLWSEFMGDEGYKLKKPQASGFDHQAHLDNGVKLAREAELKEKAFEIFKELVTYAGTPIERAKRSHEEAEAFLNYTHKNDSK